MGATGAAVSQGTRSPVPPADCFWEGAAFTSEKICTFQRHANLQPPFKITFFRRGCVRLWLHAIRFVARPQVASSGSSDRLELLSDQDLGRTLDRLASQVLEAVADSQDLVLLGIPTRGVALARVLAGRLEAICGHPIAHGSLDPTFHRDDLERVGTRLVEATQLPVPVDGRQVVLVDDVIFTGRTVRAALEALQGWGRPRRVGLLVMVDRGHRELPIQPDFCGRVVPTARHETIQLCLQAIDGEEGVYLLRD